MSIAIIPIVEVVAVLNVLTFLAFAWDKFCARYNMWRVSEGMLLLLSNFGGSLGAIGGQHLFRHKTRKEPFRTILHTIVALQVILAIAWFAIRAVIR